MCAPKVCQGQFENKARLRFRTVKYFNGYDTFILFYCNLGRKG